MENYLFIYLSISNWFYHSKWYVALSIPLVMENYLFIYLSISNWFYHSKWYVALSIPLEISPPSLSPQYIGTEKLCRYYSIVTVSERMRMCISNGGSMI